MGSPMSDDFDSKYDYNRFGAKGKRVGQAILDINAGNQAPLTVGDTLEAYAPEFARQMELCVEDGSKRYRSPFYVFVLSNKEFWADNMMRNRFIARQSPPHALKAMGEYKHFVKTLYMVDGDKGRVECVWCLPAYPDCVAIAKHPEAHDPTLVKWIEQCFTGQLDRDHWKFEEIVANVG